jgi:hypothetical protein
MSIFGNVAEMATERMEKLAGQASLRDAGTTAGIATDKLLALSSDPLSQANQHLHVHLQPVDLMDQWNEMIRKLPSALEAKDTPAKALPSGQDPQATLTANITEAADGCASAEKPAQKEN